MPQVNRTTNDLLIDALFMLGELGVGEQPDPLMLTSGLTIINELLDDFAADGIYIPFQTEVDFNFVVNQGDYTFSDIFGPVDVVTNRIVDLVQANYTVQNVVYPVQIINKAAFYGVVRLDNLIARPGFCFLNKQALETFVTFYPKPDQPYPCKLQVKQMINSLAPQDNLDALPPYYQRFLRYAVTRELKAWYPSGNWPDTNEEEYQRVWASLKAANENDLTLRPSAVLTSPQPFYWPNILAY